MRAHLSSNLPRRPALRVLAVRTNAQHFEPSNTPFRSRFGQASGLVLMPKRKGSNCLSARRPWLNQIKQPAFSRSGPTQRRRIRNEVGYSGLTIAEVNCTEDNWVLMSRRGLRLDNQWIEERFQAEDGIVFTPQAPIEAIALAAPKSTDVLRIRPATVAKGMSLDRCVLAAR